MDSEHTNPKPDGASEPTQYEPPAIVETAEFETLALACNKVGNDTLQCASNPGQS